MKLSTVVDTNLLVISNGKAPHASLDCLRACVNKLEDIQKNHVVRLDSLGLIFEEYKKHNRFEGQPGLGDAFFRWLFLNQFQVEHCEHVKLNRNSENDWDLVEFPEHDSLKSLDKSDRKFVAVANAKDPKARIVSGIERGWSKHQDALQEVGILVELVCNVQKPISNKTRKTRPPRPRS